jgi:hypothetical protein
MQDKQSNILDSKQSTIGCFPYSVFLYNSKSEKFNNEFNKGNIKRNENSPQPINLLSFSI